MKKFCECNATWTYPAIPEGMVMADGEYNGCPVCGYYYWNDAWYENEQFDLAKAKEQEETI